MRILVQFGDTGEMISGQMNNNLLRMINGRLSAWIVVSIIAFILQNMTLGSIILSEKGQAKVEIILASNVSLQEKTAAEELQNYLRKITSATFQIVDEKEIENSTCGIWVGPTKRALDLKLIPTEAEAWVVKTIDNDLILCGGRPRGTLYAIYHFLEDNLGVHWWNPQEEFVPHEANLKIETINMQGQPAFELRCINMVNVGYEPPYDNGAFMIRSRMNRRGAWGSPVDLKYGCDDGLLKTSRPWCAHTFNYYVENRNELIKEHPEYFALRDGKRITDTIDLMNPRLRDDLHPIN
jgi:hypothetical protein